ncbi:hypothetical protein QAD02_018478 [Eretmocerus hayati]|uniref:Uncharacterized protein n=1 Tax=Eretmocerus hayati TaxID=131215 RepID=A0ACC2PGX1_9HYME|nr:hypothetical protein QAD02_018478 [Eretmocerus hayati]
MVRIIFKVLAQFLLFYLVKCEDLQIISIHMPNVHPDKANSTLCASIDLGQDDTHSILAFLSDVKVNIVDYMALFACDLPKSAEPVWNCGSSVQNLKKSSPSHSSVCQHTGEAIYTWMGGGSYLSLPDDVAFKVGKGTTRKYLVLQVHYPKSLGNGITDASGFKIFHSTYPRANQAGLFIATSVNGIIQPHSPEHVEIACPMQENKTIYPMMYQVHTHESGKFVSAYVIKNGKWIELGKRVPQDSQMFHETKYNGPIEHGDIIAVRCNMENDREDSLSLEYEEETCSFDLIYYVENDEILDENICKSDGPPKYYWENDNNIRIASTM